MGLKEVEFWCGDRLTELYIAQIPEKDWRQETWNPLISLEITAVKVLSGAVRMARSITTPNEGDK